VVETLSNLSTDRARDRLEAVGFEDVTILVAGHPEAVATAASAAALNPASAAA